MSDKDEHDEYLQVFMTHDVVIEEFKQMLARNGWYLSQMPRFSDESDDNYVRTHIVTPHPDVFRSVGIPTPNESDKQ